MTVDDIRELVMDNELNEADLVSMVAPESAIEDSFEDQEETKEFSLKIIDQFFLWQIS